MLGILHVFEEHKHTIQLVYHFKCVLTSQSSFSYHCVQLIMSLQHLYMYTITSIKLLQLIYHFKCTFSLVQLHDVTVIITITILH